MTKKIAFLFPGQGSQSVGMLNAFKTNSATASLYTTAALEAEQALGQNLAALIEQGPAESLNLTTNTQPAMLMADVLVLRAWLAAGGSAPDLVAGHSLGEYAALVAAGVFSFSEGLGLVRIRAQAMQEAVPVGVGGMAAILGLDAQAVKAGCAQAAAEVGEAVEAVNFNDPKQTVIAGTKAAVEKACEVLKAAGAKRALPLPVSAPFHSSLMKPAAERLMQQLAATPFAAPGIPVINNIDVAAVDEPQAIRDALYRQAFGPVRWVETVQALKARGLTHVFECGPGKVLAGMIKRIDADLITATVLDPATLQDVKGML